MEEKPKPVRILIADDHGFFRDALRKLLEAEPDFTVVGTATDDAEAVTLARQLQPDILLLDLAMPRLTGLEALRELAAAPLPVRPSCWPPPFDLGRFPIANTIPGV